MSYYEKYCKYKKLYLAGSKFLTDNLPMNNINNITSYLPIETDITVNKSTPTKKKGTDIECQQFNMNGYKEGCLNVKSVGDFHQTICCSDIIFNLENTDTRFNNLDYDLFYYWISSIITQQNSDLQLTFSIQDIFYKYHTRDKYIGNVDNENILYNESNIFLRELYEYSDIPFSFTPITLYNSNPEFLNDIQFEIFIFDILRLIFGLFNPIIPDYIDNENINRDIVRCKWNKAIWSLYWTCLLYSYLNSGGEDHIEDELIESELVIIFYEEIFNGINLTFNEIYQKIFNNIDLDLMERLYWSL